MAENSSPPDDPALANELTRPRLLIGEGSDEVFFFKALLKNLAIDDVQIEGYDGKDNLFDYLDGLRDRPGFSHLRVLVVTRDADGDPAGALAAVRGALQGNGFVVPPQPGVKLEGKPAVSFLILPGSNQAGMLEDLCLASLKHDAAWGCVGTYFDCLQEKGAFPSHEAKARFRAWLAVQSKSDVRGVGGAAKADFFNWDSAAFENLKLFLTQAFSDESN